MWYGKLMGGEEEQLLATVQPLLEAGMDSSCVHPPCNHSLLNSTGLGMDGTGAYRAAIREFKQSLMTHEDFRSVLLLLLYVPIFSLAFVGNGLVLTVVILNRTMRNVTNLLLLNLAVADLSVSLVCVPIAVGESMYKAWLFGGFMCKFAAFLQGTTVTASIFTISLLSVDRYLAIKKPVLSRRIGSKRIAVKLVVFIWTTSALPMIPLFLFRKVDEINFVSESSIHFCREDWLSPLDRLIYDISVCVVVYLIPGVTITTSYILIGRKLWHEDENLQRQESEISRRISRQVMNSRKRIAKMLIALALLFMLCWLPYHITCLLLDATHVLNGTHQDDVTRAMALLPYTILAGHSNSAINPIIYFYASRSFRRCVLKVLHCKKNNEHNESRHRAVVKYTPVADGHMKPLVRLMSSTTPGPRSRSTGSFRFSRSASLRSSRSFRSTGSFRRHETTGKTSIKPKLKDVKVHEKKTNTVPQINIAEAKMPDENNHENTEIGEKHRRDMFSCTLSIPTTINEESRSSRPTTPLRDMPSAIPEEDVGPEYTLHVTENPASSTSTRGQHDVQQTNAVEKSTNIFIFPQSLSDKLHRSPAADNADVVSTEIIFDAQSRDITTRIQDMSEQNWDTNIRATDAVGKPVCTCNYSADTVGKPVCTCNYSADTVGNHSADTMDKPVCICNYTADTVGNHSADTIDQPVRICNYTADTVGNHSADTVDKPVCICNYTADTVGNHSGDTMNQPVCICNYTADTVGNHSADTVDKPVCICNYTADIVRNHSADTMDQPVCICNYTADIVRNHSADTMDKSVSDCNDTVGSCIFDYSADIVHKSVRRSDDAVNTVGIPVCICDYSEVTVDK